MFISFDRYLSTFYHIIGYVLVIEAINAAFCPYISKKTTKERILVHTKEHNIKVQLTSLDVTHELALLHKYQMKCNKTTPKAYSENICNTLNIKAKLFPFERDNKRIVKHNRELKQKTPPVVRSVVVYKIALNLNAQLYPLKPGSESITDMQQKTKTRKTFSKIHSIFYLQNLKRFRSQGCLSITLE
ncbi:hypothetical protein NPIL_600531 [Nephila pilipes]|uniref:Uncharacterized protein n=1 Tax=Nephila pilipes TaxID=299642 RepID=A0A8X6QP78_NEPPI|nr:hypothetical protein NPIL_600531 [Nephila pilipes]